MWSGYFTTVPQSRHLRPKISSVYFLTRRSGPDVARLVSLHVVHLDPPGSGRVYVAEYGEHEGQYHAVIEGGARVHIRV